MNDHPRTPRSPTMIRTGYDLVKRSPPRSCDPALRPALAASDGDAFGDWLAHLDAGRIEVR